MMLFQFTDRYFSAVLDAGRIERTCHAFERRVHMLTTVRCKNFNKTFETFHMHMYTCTAIFKPRFGGINFSLNTFRAAIVGPLTFFLWIYWSFTRRGANFLKSFHQSHQRQQMEQMHQHRKHHHQEPKSGDPKFPVSSTSKSTSKPFQTHQHVHEPKQQEVNVTSSQASTSHRLYHQGNNGGRVYAKRSSSASGNRSQQQPVHHHPSCLPVCSQDLKHEHTVHAPSFLAATGEAEETSASMTSATGAATVAAAREGSRRRKKRKRRKERRRKMGCDDASDASFRPVESLHWTSIDLPRIYRIKQITRSCLNDVILAAISGNTLACVCVFVSLVHVSLHAIIS